MRRVGDYLGMWFRRRHSEATIEAVLGGRAPAERADLAEVGAFVASLREVFADEPARAWAPAIMPIEVGSLRRTRLAIAAVVGGATLAFGGFASAGALPDQVQGEVARVANRLGLGFVPMPATRQLNEGDSTPDPDNDPAVLSDPASGSQHDHDAENAPGDSHSGNDDADHGEHDSEHGDDDAEHGEDEHGDDEHGDDDNSGPSDEHGDDEHDDDQSADPDDGAEHSGSEDTSEDSGSSDEDDEENSEDSEDNSGSGGSGSDDSAYEDPSAD